MRIGLQMHALSTNKRVQEAVYYESIVVCSITYECISAGLFWALNSITQLRVPELYIDHVYELQKALSKKILSVRYKLGGLILLGHRALQSRSQTDHVA